ncbi:MAG: DUF4321 domain-containing protein [Fibrobacteres bacterium]|nr:DUF4321 domain-containing protein [Fibrobacterota bacterium]
MRDKPLSVLLVIIVTGFIVGSILGQALGLLLPESTPKAFLLESYSPSFGFLDNGPLIIDLFVIKIKFGVQFTFNIVGVIGVAVASYIFRWYK